MTPEEQTQYRAHLDYFDRDAHVVVDGQRYTFSERDLHDIAMEGRFFTVVGGLNTSVFCGAISVARRAFRPRLGRAQILALCAATLKTTVDDVEHALDWRANYMAMHDGTEVEDNHPYPPSEP